MFMTIRVDLGQMAKLKQEQNEEKVMKKRFKNLHNMLKLMFS